MNSRYRILYPGALYHVYNRGNDKHPVFRDDEDRMKYLWFVVKYLQELSVVLIAYCLLGTHFHLFLQTLLANLPEFMQRLHSAYARWYNKKRDRTGHLFTDRYKAAPVQDDVHALELSRYIHLNPVRAGLVARPEEWQWSSYRHYVGLEQSSVLNTDIVMRQISSDQEKQAEGYGAFVMDGLTNGTAWEEPPLKQGIFLGDDSFVEKISKLTKPAVPPLFTQLEPPASPVSIYKILEFVLAESGLGFRDLRESRLHSDAQWRNMFVFLSRRLARASVNELARFLGLSPGEISRLAHRFQLKAAKDPGLLEATENIVLGLCGSDIPENVKM
jgi:REP element-mobilizing transposase RayT